MRFRSRLWRKSLRPAGGGLRAPANGRELGAMGSQRAPERYSIGPILACGAGGEDVEGRAAGVGDAVRAHDDRSVETIASRIIAERPALGGRMTGGRGNDSAVAQLNAHHLERRRHWC